MSSLFGGMMGGGGKAQQVDWKQLEKMMDYSAQMNRYNDQGIFGGTEWTENEDGSWKREHVVNEALQPGIDALMSRFGSGQPAERTSFGMPSQMASLMDAKMSNQMQRHGVLNDQTLPNLAQDNYGTRFGDQREQAFQEVQKQQQPQQPQQMPAQQQAQMQAQVQPQKQQQPQQMSEWDRMAAMRKMGAS